MNHTGESVCSHHRSVQEEQAGYWMSARGPHNRTGDWSCRGRMSHSVSVVGRSDGQPRMSWPWSDPPFRLSGHKSPASIIVDETRVADLRHILREFDVRPGHHVAERVEARSQRPSGEWSSMIRALCGDIRRSGERRNRRPRKARDVLTAWRPCSRLPVTPIMFVIVAGDVSGRTIFSQTVLSGPGSS